MRFKFSQFTGRLSAPTPLEIPSKYGKATEGPTIQYMEGTKLTVHNHPAARGRYAAVPTALQTKMRIFQFPNDMPVHIKGGPTDRILYVLTAAVCFIGLVDCFRVYYRLSYPSKKE
ncbi:cytochrome c oxidase subunit 7A2-like, mitochondrial isoform X1 [Panulirus ornatus]|uniref:cytochrome c oxidase subunit 7A2-like, mitochondrial isoform X1 n=1 Tax=Panulirus ornatus TaxID=150431 RepID=UPI003A8C5784